MFWKAIIVYQNILYSRTEIVLVHFYRFVDPHGILNLHLKAFFLVYWAILLSFFSQILVQFPENPIHYPA
jgi:hypothetical protein